MHWSPKWGRAGWGLDKGAIASVTFAAEGISMPIIPPLPRYFLEKNADELHVNIPSRRNWSWIVFSAFWLLLWALGEIVVLGVAIVMLGMFAVSIFTEGLRIGKMDSG